MSSRILHLLHNLILMEDIKRDIKYFNPDNHLRDTYLYLYLYVNKDLFKDEEKLERIKERNWCTSCPIYVSKEIEFYSIV